MRKSAAFLLLSCFGIYHLGYFVVQFLMPLAIHHHWENQVWESHESSLSGRLVRVPFTKPYGQNQEDFQPANFAMEIDGKMSRVIGQRYFEDHLEVLVVQDELRTKLDEQVKLWIFSLGSDPGGFDGPPLQKLLLKSFLKDFLPQPSGWELVDPLQKIAIDHSTPFLFDIPSGIKDIFLTPPRAIRLS